MAGYFEELGWRELRDGEQPNHHLHLARAMIDYGMYNSDLMSQWPELAPPASREIVKSLPDKVIEGNNENCPICMKSFEVGKKAKQLPCSHLYHPSCILKWLQKTNSCPFCRYELPTDNEAYEAFKKDQQRAALRKKDIDTLHDSMFS